MRGAEYLPGPDNETIVRGYLDWQKNTRRRRAVTVYQYAGKLVSFLEWIGTTPLANVSTGHMEAWLRRPRPGRGHGAEGSAATIQKEVAILRGLYRYALAREWLTADPTALLHAPTPHNEHPKPVPDETWTPLWKGDLCEEARLVLGLGYFCGLRRAEIANLRGSHIHGEQLRGFVRKGGGDDVLDYVELVGVVADHLPDLIPGGPDSFLLPLSNLRERAGDGLLLDWTATSHTSQRLHGRTDEFNDPQLVYKRMARWGCTFTPHQLRHSFVTNMLRCGVPIHLVSRLANHSSITITMRYAKLGGADLRDWRRAALNPSTYNRWE